MIYTVEGLENDHPVRDILFHLFPAETIERVDIVPEDADALGVLVQQVGMEHCIRVCCQRAGKQVCTQKRAGISDDAVLTRRQLTHAVKLAIFEAATPFLDAVPEWGSLTGVRPAKFARGFLEQGLSPAQVAKIMTEQYHVSSARRALAIRSAGIALDCKNKLQPNDISIYIGIPFCPSRCSYCSFVSHAIEKAGKLMAEYLNTLCAEIQHTGVILEQAGLRIVSIYIGGGTPTTLSAQQLDRLLHTMQQVFDLHALEEFTVEAGRPDTITKEKLLVLQQYGVDRISINPQSMNEAVLAAIGRRHSPQAVLDCFRIAREIGFHAINMDVIAGLDEDTPESFAATLDTLIGLEPENITVHTLAAKRGADQHDRVRNAKKQELVRQMLDIAAKKLTMAGYAPYYLYRQKFMAGGFENVGWCKPGYECKYNIYMMEELQTIISLGAGGVTKLLGADGRKIQRISNPKYPYEYNVSLEKINAGKQAILQWAQSCGMQR
ncbi:MAG: coproporphyrinogen dehydrogenase HemZ [Eubacteriales bacterium]|nr:coproporphyrinogen dehydrogenase HemZ [Eubacteriales bacterium]